MQQNKEFNPTSDNRVDLERDIMDLKICKNNLVNNKLKIQSELSNIKENLNNPHFDENDYINFKKDKLDKINNLFHIENDLKKVNDEMKAKRKLFIAVDDFLRNKKNGEKYNNKIIEDIKRLKIKYSKFSSDHTRISSMRMMAADISLELDNIINK